LSTGNCTGELIDLDKNGVLEFQTCDDMFAYEFCSFAFSPMPTVVLAYDARKGAFALATPRLAKYLPDPKRAQLDDARKTMAENRADPEISRCAAFGPALSLIYSGRINEGLAIFRQLYRRPDRAMLEQKAMDMVKKSPLWVER